jgi:hypothetical protein
MTREQARQVARKLRQRYPGGTVDVTRVFGGVEVTAAGESGYVFLRADDDSPLLALFGAAPGTGHEDSPRHGPRTLGPIGSRASDIPAARAGGNPCPLMRLRGSRGSRPGSRSRPGAGATTPVTSPAPPSSDVP